MCANAKLWVNTLDWGVILVLMGYQSCPYIRLRVLPRILLISNTMSLLPSAPGFASLTPRIPPYFLNTDHRQRCLAQLRSKHDGLEKYIYLSGLKERDPNLFYEVLLGNMLEIIPILYTPTVCSRASPIVLRGVSDRSFAGWRCVLSIFAYLASA